MCPQRVRGGRHVRPASVLHVWSSRRRPSEKYDVTVRSSVGPMPHAAWPGKTSGRTRERVRARRHHRTRLGGACSCRRRHGPGTGGRTSASCRAAVARSAHERAPPTGQFEGRPLHLDCPGLGCTGIAGRLERLARGARGVRRRHRHVRAVARRPAARRFAACARPHARRLSLRALVQVRLCSGPEGLWSPAR